jgi:hypothetical protein
LVDLSFSHSVLAGFTIDKYLDWEGLIFLGGVGYAFLVKLIDNHVDNNGIPIWQLLPKILLKQFQDLYVPLDKNQVEPLGHEVERKRFSGFVACAIDDGICLLTCLSGYLLRWSGGWDLLLLGTSGW